MICGGISSRETETKIYDGRKMASLLWRVWLPTLNMKRKRELDGGSFFTTKNKLLDYFERLLTEAYFRHRKLSLCRFFLSYCSRKICIVLYMFKIYILYIKFRILCYGILHITLSIVSRNTSHARRKEIFSTASLHSSVEPLLVFTKENILHCSV